MPTGMSEVPSGTRNLAMTPSSCTSKSTVALSVSTSAMVSPAPTASPSFFNQRAMFPTVIVGDRAGMSRTVCEGNDDNARLHVTDRAPRGTAECL